MLRSHRRLNWCLAAILGLSFAGSARAEDYKIKLMRSLKVGDEIALHVTSKSSQVVSVNPNMPQAFMVELTGAVKVLAVNEKTGTPTKLSCTVSKLTNDGNDLYPAGTVITGEKVNKMDTYTIDGNPVDAMNVPMLSAVLELTDPTRATTDDEMYGTDQPQAIGGTWPVSPDKLAADLAEEGLPVPAESLKGTVKLDDVKKVSNVDAMLLNTHITADGFKATLPGAAVTDGKLDVAADMIMPVNPSLPGLSMKMKLHMSMTITPQNAAGQVITMTLDRETAQEQQLVKK